MGKEKVEENKVYRKRRRAAMLFILLLRVCVCVEFFEGILLRCLRIPKKQKKKKKLAE
jgi:hypothetical protein